MMFAMTSCSLTGRTAGQPAGVRSVAPSALGARARSANPARRPVAVRAGDDKSDGVSPAFPEGLVNAITVALTNSPINEGKKWLARNQAGPYNSAEWKAKIEAEVAATPVVFYSFSSCPFCKKAKAILADANAGIGASMKVLELDEMGQEGKIYRAALSEMTGRTSMPQIFIKTAGFVGGCNDGPGVATLAKEGKLEPMLRAAAASIKA